MSKAEFQQWLASAIGEPPGDLKLYVRAVTHGSHGEADYQRLEFLGDRVLGLIITDHLYHNHANEPEGRLSQRLNRLVSGATCAEVARAIDVSGHLLLGKQARDDGARQSTKVLGDVMESLIGAIYLDLGMDTARNFVLRHWAEKIEGMQADNRHPKSVLQEWAAAHRRKPPRYELIDKHGPDHDLKFTVQLTVDHVGSVEATASAIQTAETEAARKFLEQHT